MGESEAGKRKNLKNRYGVRRGSFKKNGGLGQQQPERSLTERSGRKK